MAVRGREGIVRAGSGWRMEKSVKIEWLLDAYRFTATAFSEFHA